VSSTGTGEHRSVPAEQHLGDRLAAFVDGELTDDSRDRVLAHLATCPQCKAAAAEQRRLKSVVAASELPAISAGLLARLQGLPGTGPGDGNGTGFGTGDRQGGIGPGRGTARGSDGSDDPRGQRTPWGQHRDAIGGGGLVGAGVFGPRRDDFSYLSPAQDLVAAADSRGRGFRVHEPSRGRRFAFAAAGAFSLAAIAIGSALPMEAAVDGGARPDDGPAVSPLSANSVSDTRGVVPRGMLESSERQGPSPAPVAAATSATTVSLDSRSTFVLH
jgi:hypothetical protein